FFFAPEEMGLVVSPFSIGLLAESVGRAEPVGFECFFLRSIACLFLFVGFLMSRVLFLRLRFLFRFGGGRAVGIYDLFFFFKYSNGQGSQSRVYPVTASSEASGSAPTATAHRTVQNSADPSWCRFSDAQASGRAKPVTMPTTRNASRAIPKAPASQSAAGASNSAAPSKEKLASLCYSHFVMLSSGDTSSAFTLQFGSINPGMMNGLQVT
ncbi:hypothetical protein GW17_00002033, partial [Ensete ventricosum]